jgi:hypothetical protein
MVGGEFVVCGRQARAFCALCPDWLAHLSLARPVDFP